MPFFGWIVLEAGCTAIYLPGWAAILVVLVAAAPRLASRILEDRTG